MKKISFLATFSIITLLTIRGVSACSCLPPSPPEEAFMESDAVFTGVVSDIDSNELGFDVTFTVSGSYGEESLTNEIIVSTAKDSAACGISFEDGEEYLVYATQDEGEYSANLCSRTTQITSANEDITALNTLVENEEIEYFTYSNLVEEDDESNTTVILGILFGILFFSGIAYFGYKTIKTKNTKGSK